MPATARGDRLAGALAWAAGRLDEAHSIDSLARRAAMSRRTFTRHVQRHTGTTVLQWLLHQRLARASRLLEASDHDMETIAGESGFGSTASLRQHFGAAFGVSPAAYRRQFRAP